MAKSVRRNTSTAARSGTPPRSRPKKSVRRPIAPGDKALRIALLIDADNSSPAHPEHIIPAIEARHTLTARRAYRSWADDGLERWKDILNRLAIQPVHQFAAIKGKNATDIAMVIDAMDMLHSGKYDGFCFLTSDSDFTALVKRLREAGMVVYGGGMAHTPSTFISACDEFFFMEDLMAPPPKPRDDRPVRIERVIKRVAPPIAHPERFTSRAERLAATISEIFARRTEGKGWLSLATLGSELHHADPEFDSRRYGHERLADLVLALPYLRTKEAPDEKDPRQTQLLIRLKKPRKTA